MVLVKVIAFVLWSTAMVFVGALVPKFWTTTDHSNQTGEAVAAVRLQSTHLEGSDLGEFQRDKPESSLVQRSHQSFESQDGRFRVGIWEAKTGAIEIPNPYPGDELMYVLSGKFALIDQQGNRQECSEGEGMILPKGWTGTFEVPESVRKIWVYYK